MSEDLKGLPKLGPKAPVLVSPSVTYTDADVPKLPDAKPDPTKGMAVASDAVDNSEAVGLGEASLASADASRKLRATPEWKMPSFGTSGVVQGEASAPSVLGGQGVIDGIKKTYDNQAVIAKELGDLEAKKFDTEAQILNESRQLAESAMRASQERHNSEAADIAKRQKEIAEEANRLTGERVDSGKFYANPGNVISALVLAVSPAFSRNMAGGKGLALANQALERDLETQKFNIQSARSNLEAKRNILHDYRQIMGSNDAGDMLYMAKANEVAANKLKESALRIGGQQAMANAKMQIEAHERAGLEYMQKAAMIAHRDAKLQNPALVKASAPRYGTNILDPRIPGSPGQPPTAKQVAEFQAAQSGAAPEANVATLKAELPPEEESTADRLFKGSAHWGQPKAEAQVDVISGGDANAKPEAPVMTIPEVVISGKRLTPDLLKKAVANAGGGRPSAQQAAQAAVAKRSGDPMTIGEVRVEGDNRTITNKYADKMISDVNRNYNELAMKQFNPAEATSVSEFKERVKKYNAFIDEKVNEDEKSYRAAAPALKGDASFIGSVADASNTFKRMKSTLTAEEYNDLHKRYRNETVQGIADAFRDMRSNSETSKERISQMEAYYNWRSQLAILGATYKKSVFGQVSATDKAAADEVISGSMPYLQMEAALKNLNAGASRSLYTTVKTSMTEGGRAKWMKDNPGLAAGYLNSNENKVGGMTGNKAE